MKKRFTNTYYANCPHCREGIEITQTFLGKMKIEESNQCPACKQHLEIKHDRIMMIMEIIAIIIFLLFTENKYISLFVILLVYAIMLTSRSIKRGLIKYGYYRIIKK